MGMTPGMAWLQSGVIHPLFVMALNRGGYPSPKATPIGFGDSFTRSTTGKSQHGGNAPTDGDPAPHYYPAKGLPIDLA